MIKRIKEYGKKEPCRDAHKIYIVCEGKETEPAYFSFFKNCSSNLEIIAIPPTVGTDTLKLLDNAKEQLLGEHKSYNVDYAHGDTVWFTFDTDLNEKEGKISPLREFCNSMNAEIKSADNVKPYIAWNVAESNPSFEVWLYYHFYNEKPSDEEVETYQSFKDFVNSKIVGGFNFQKDPAHLERAITYATPFMQKKGDTLSKYATEMITLGTEILGFTKKELDKIKNKLG